MNGFRISCSPLWKKELFGCLWIFKESSESPKIHNPIRNIGFWRVVFYCDFFGLKPSKGTWLRILKRGRIVWRRVLFAHSVRLHEKADAFLEPDKSTSQNKTGEKFGDASVTAPNWAQTMTGSKEKTNKPPMLFLSDWIKKQAMASKHFEYWMVNNRFYFHLRSLFARQ